MFKDIFGESTQTTILDFLAGHLNYDYSISEIAKNSQLSRPTVYKIIDILIKNELIIQTRKHGKSPLYKLNNDNKLVQMILEFDFEKEKKVAEIESHELVKKYSPDLVKSNKKVSKPKRDVSYLRIR